MDQNLLGLLAVGALVLTNAFFLATDFAIGAQLAAEGKASAKAAQAVVGRLLTCRRRIHPLLHPHPVPRLSTISVRATWLAFTGKIQLPILVEKDPVLLNVYHVMPVNPDRFPNVPINVAGGKAFADFMVAPATQKVIGEFGMDKYGQALFVPASGSTSNARGAVSGGDQVKCVCTAGD